MENTGFKGLLTSLYQRIILSYKTTLIGLAVAAVGVIADYYVNSPNKIVAGIFAAIGGVLVFIKEQYPPPGLPPSP